MRDGSELRLGVLQLKVRFASSGRAAAANPSPTHGAIMLSGFDDRGNAIQHVVRSDGRSAAPGQMITLATVGRDASNDIRLDSKTVSRRHALIGIDQNGTICVRDLGSSNGTFVDNQRANNLPVRIETAKTVAFGDLGLTVSRLTN